jgi:hypothetical protein
MTPERIKGILTTDDTRDNFTTSAIPVGELTAESGQIVQIGEDRMAQLLAADPDPHPAKFVTVEVKQGQSKNNRHWSREILAKIADQINAKEPLAYKGHPFLKKDFDRGSDFPDPQTLWLGAVIVDDSSGTRLVAKGYNLTDEIRKGLRVGAVNSVSICGDADMVRRRGGGYDVEDFELLSMDWARKDGEGMEGRVLSLTGEMEEETHEGSELVKPEDIAGITEGDLRRHAPSLVEQIEKAGADKATEELTTTVGEMETAAAEAKPSVDAVTEIRKLLKLDDKDDVIEKIGEVLAQARGVIKAKYDEAVEKTLGKIKDEDVRGLVKSLVGEMDEDIEDEEKAFEAGTSAVNELLDTNDHVKKLVGEMADEEDDRGDGRPRALSHRRDGDQTGNRKKDTTNIAHETVKVS